MMCKVLIAWQFLSSIREGVTLGQLSGSPINTEKSRENIESRKEKYPVKCPAIPPYVLYTCKLQLLIRLRVLPPVGIFL